MADLVKLVYAGWCTLADHKPGAVLLQVGEDGTTLGSELIFGRKALDGSFIGAVYEVEKTGDTSFKLASRRYVGKFQDEAVVAQWQLDARAKKIEEEAARLEKKDKDIPAALNLMAPLRKLYRNSLPDRKRAIEALLLDYLRR